MSNEMSVIERLIHNGLPLSRVDAYTLLMDRDRLKAEVERLERDLDKVMAERDAFEEKITELGAEAGCPEEWTNLHDHGDCVTNEWADKLKRSELQNESLRCALEDCVEFIKAVDEQVGPERMKGFRVDPYGTLKDAQDALQKTNGRCSSTTGTDNQVRCIKESGHGSWHEDGMSIRWKE